MTAKKNSLLSKEVLKEVRSMTKFNNSILSLSAMYQEKMCGIKIANLYSFNLIVYGKTMSVWIHLQCALMICL